jgi:hypothetical protein
VIGVRLDGEAGDCPRDLAGQPPVSGTKELHDGGHEHHSDHGGVDEYGDRQPETEHAEYPQRIADDERAATEAVIRSGTKNG